MSTNGETGADMIVDCDSCEVRGDACGDCVITALLGSPPGEVELDGTERRALENLAAAGMLPRLQLVHRDEHHGVRDRPCAGCGTGGSTTREGVQRSNGEGERSVRRVG